MTAANQPTAHPSLSALYRDHHGWLAGWLRRRLGSAHDAADLSHDTYERLMVSGRLPEAGQARAFLTQIAKGLVIDLFRRRTLETAYLEALAAMPEPVARPSRAEARQKACASAPISKSGRGSAPCCGCRSRRSHARPPPGCPARR